jgi:DNA-binding SARP family transcriptional activator
MQFKILGSLEALHGGRACTPTPPKLRWVLALMLVRANQVVALDTLIEELWDEAPPKSAVTTVQTYIYQLRKAFLNESGSDEALVTSPPGYILRVHPDQLDSVTFERLMEQGRSYLDAGSPELASRAFRRALEQWRGRALADVSCGRHLEAHVAHLEELKIQAIEMRIRADMQLVQYRQLIPELRALVVQYPLNEWLHARLIEALHLSDRRGEALGAYQRLRSILNNELGLEPNAEIQRLQLQLLKGERPATVQVPVRTAAKGTE